MGGIQLSRRSAKVICALPATHKNQEFSKHTGELPLDQRHFPGNLNIDTSTARKQK